MAAKSIISAVLFGVEVPKKSGRVINFGNGYDEVFSPNLINSRIIHFLKSTKMPCTANEIAFEVDQDIKTTEKALDRLLRMEVIKYTNLHSKQRTYELIKYLA